MMKKKLKELCLIFVFVISGLLTLSSCGSAKSSKIQEARNQGDYIPYIMELTDASGNTISMSSLKNKVLFINIWATWCPPCRKEMPSIQALYDRVNSPDVEFILVAPEDRNKLNEFLKSNDLQLPVYQITKGLPAVLSDEYIPRTFIVDKFGKIVHKHVGERDWNTAEIYDFISFLATSKVKAN
jgi:thiol-disulfide isomerase/thioredoxin